MQLFPDIGLAKCIPGFDGKEYRPGIVGLIILPVLAEAYTPHQPVATSYMLLRIWEEMQQYVSGYVKEVIVMNPEYVEIRVRCGLKFHSDCSVSLGKNRLQQLINNWIAPWQGIKQLPDIDSDLSLSVLYQQIHREMDIEDIFYLTVIRVGREGQLYELTEYRHGQENRIEREPHVIYIPVKEHTIHVFSGEPGLGIDEMEIDENLIIM